MHDHCTCGHHLDDDDIPPGKVMFIGHQSNGPLTRAVIMFHDFSDGEPGEGSEPETLYRTSWYQSARKAEREALHRYWPLYEFKHGFKHPEDPRRTRDDVVPAGMSVVVDRGGAG